jgi:hypothetical protein
MDLMGRLDPELAAVFPHIPVLDLTDIPTARTVMMDMLAAANEGVQRRRGYRKRLRVLRKILRSTQFGLTHSDH